jgi:hypothetical protein
VHWKESMNFKKINLPPYGAGLIGTHLVYLPSYLNVRVLPKHLKDKVPRGNGTICRVLKIKLKQDAPSYKWKNYYGRKVWTVDATDVEYVECEHVNKTGIMLQLDTQIKHLTNQIDQEKQQNQTELDKIKFNIEKTKTMLSTIMNDRKFKLETELCLPKISINSSLDKKKSLGNFPLFFSKNSVSPALIVSLSWLALTKTVEKFSLKCIL